MRRSVLVEGRGRVTPVPRTRPSGMRWLLILPFVVACDRVRPPEQAEQPAVPAPPPAPVVAVVAAPDTAPVVTLQSAPDSTVAIAPDSVVAVVRDSAVVAKPESSVVRPRALVIPAWLSRLPPDPENEPLAFDAVGAPVDRKSVVEGKSVDR